MLVHLFIINIKISNITWFGYYCTACNLGKSSFFFSFHSTTSLLNFLSSCRLQNLYRTQASTLSLKNCKHDKKNIWLCFSINTTPISRQMGHSKLRTEYNERTTFHQNFFSIKNFFCYPKNYFFFTCNNVETTGR